MSVREMDERPAPEDGRASSSARSTIEANAIKKIVRENWESRLTEKGTNVDILNRHAEFMTRELGSMDYEALCMQNIASHAKHMSRGELLTYTQLVEALAVGYKNRFGSAISRLLIAGVTLISKDPHTLTAHFAYFVSHISASSSAYLKAIEKEAKGMESIETELRKKNSGLLRFFRKREIAYLNEKRDEKKARIDRLEGKKKKFDALSDALKARAAPHLGAKPKI